MYFGKQSVKFILFFTKKFMNDFLTNNIPYISSQIGTIGELMIISEDKNKATVTYKRYKHTIFKLVMYKYYGNKSTNSEP